MRGLNILFFVLLVLWSTTTQAERRVALVIGNSNYVHLPKLNNPGKDGRDIAAALRRLNFKVITAFEASERQMHRAISRFGRQLGPDTTGLVYYAGHGIQSNGRNYLIPVDANLETDADLASDAINLNRVLREMKSANNPLNIVILDACRNNPLPSNGRRTPRGLAIIHDVPRGALGTSIFYAAAAGKVAQDGPKGQNSVFTAALLRYMHRPQWTLERVFKATIRDVRRKTGGRQEPWQQGSMQGDFFFNPAPKVAKPVPRTNFARHSSDREALFWESVKDSKDIADYQAYLQQYPKGIFAPLARSRIRSLQAQKQPKPLGGPQPTMPPAQAEIPVHKPYVLLKNANVRATPSLGAEKVMSLPKGTVLQVSAKTATGKWYHVEFHGLAVGYIYGDLLIAKAILDARIAEDVKRKEDAERRRVVKELRRREEAERRRLAEELHRREDAERRRLAAEKRKRQEAERHRLAEEKRLRRSAERRRLAEETRIRQEMGRLRLAEEKRKRREAKRLRLAEKKRLRQESERLRLVEEQRQRKEADRHRLAEKKRKREEAEHRRVLEKQRKREAAEQLRIAEQNRQREDAERKRLAAEKRQRQAAERKRLAGEKRQREEAERLRLAEEQRQHQEAERSRLAEEQRQREDVERRRLAEEQRQREKIERQRIAEEQRQREAAERRRALKEKRERTIAVARVRAAAEAVRLAKQIERRQEDERRRLAEEVRKREAAMLRRLAEEKSKREAAERRRLEAEKRKQEEAARERLAEQKRQKEEAERERLAEQERKREEAERQRRVEEKLKQEEAKRRHLAEDIQRRAYANKYSAGTVFQDCPDCPQMSVLPVGGFAMGVSEEEAKRLQVSARILERERPIQNIKLNHRFALGRYEVIRSQYATFVADTKYSSKSPCWYFNGTAWSKNAGKTWRDPGYAQADSHPVACVSWRDAQAYLKWLSNKSGQKYRLPSSSEWEYAARAGTATVRYWGDDWQHKQGCRFGNLADKGSGWTPAFNCSDGFANTAPIGRYRANGFGLFDMLGNLWEWTQDCVSLTYQNMPLDGRPLRRRDCLLKVIRGGSWFTKPDLVRSSHRHGYRADHGVFIVGFRVARSIQPWKSSMFKQKPQQ